MIRAVSFNWQTHHMLHALCHSANIFFRSGQVSQQSFSNLPQIQKRLWLWLQIPFAFQRVPRNAQGTSHEVARAIWKLLVRFRGCLQWILHVHILPGLCESWVFKDVCSESLIFIRCKGNDASVACHDSWLLNCCNATLPLAHCSKIRADSDFRVPRTFF